MLILAHIRCRGVEDLIVGMLANSRLAERRKAGVRTRTCCSDDVQL